MFKEICEIDGCDRNATHLTTTETKYIQICTYHFNEKYRR
jgi:hypothetical protein